ncbi:hypothetical protein AB0P12_13860 [Streptomyces subrutilus]|uniref:hypothetical protein n=1 Tax=Streptomyces subrutilus TaxID=36818 RepID=UPI003410C305
MTTEPELGAAGSADSDDVREARLAIDAFLTGGSAGHGEVPAGTDLERWRATGRIDDRLAAQVAGAAWDAVQDATPPAPDPSTDPGPDPTVESGPSAELAARHRRAVAVARGLAQLGYHLDETLRPGPDMAAG